MLIRLSSDQISRYWDDIEAAVRAAVPPLGQATEAGMLRLLERLLGGDMHAWLLVSSIKTSPAVPPNHEIHALCITTIWEDIGTGARNLHIYALYGYSLIPDELWHGGIETLRQFAKAENCAGIVAFSSVPRILEIVKRLGGKSDTHLIQIEV